MLDDAEVFVALAEGALNVMAQSPDAAEQSKHLAVKVLREHQPIQLRLDPESQLPIRPIP